MTDHINRLRQRLIAGQDDERGAAMAEYGLLLALIAMAAILVLSAFGDTLVDTFGFASDAMGNLPTGNATTP